MANGQNEPNPKNLEGNGQGMSGRRVLALSFVKEKREITQFSPRAENEKIYMTSWVRSTWGFTGRLGSQRSKGSGRWLWKALGQNG